MAGSLSHIVDDNGTFRMDLIENLGDAHEALDECFRIIYKLTDGKRTVINPVCRELSFPTLTRDMQLGGSDSLA